MSPKIVEILAPAIYIHPTCTVGHLICSWYDDLTFNLSTDVEIGLQECAVAVNENEPFVQVCVSILSGCIKRNVPVYLNILEGSATGMKWVFSEYAMSY